MDLSTRVTSYLREPNHKAISDPTWPAPITKARDAESGTVRGDFAMSQQYNLVHASESIEIAKKETMLIFNKDEICEWDKKDLQNIYLKDELV